MQRGTPSVMEVFDRKVHVVEKGTIFLDYDGTIHDSMGIYGPAFKEVYSRLVKEGYLTYKEQSDEAISHWLGWTADAMWKAFAPELPESVAKKASLEIGRIMNARLDAGKGVLFPGIKEALKQLKQEGYELVFLSNCGRSYRDKHFEIFGLADLFSGSYAAEDYNFIPKWEIYKNVCADYPMPHLMVGDRFHDIEVATKAGIPSIGCAYGFGEPKELEAATVIVNAPLEIPDAVHELIG